PEPVVLDVEQDALSWTVQPVPESGFIARPPVGELRATRKRGLQEGSQVRREPEAEPDLGGSGLRIGKPGSELNPVDRGVRHDQPEAVLSAAELVHQFLPKIANHLALPPHRLTG